MDWTEDNFGNEGARQFLQVQAARLLSVIRDVVADPDRLDPGEDGESMLMPCIEVLAFLCERYDLPPPMPAAIRSWHEQYLKAFDAGFDKMKPPPGLKPLRRKVIEKTFRWLESLSESYHTA